MWLNLVEQAKTLESIFKNDIVTLENIKIRRIEIDCLNGWIFKIYIDLNQYPSNPPLKWTKNKNNTVQIGLNFIENEIINFQNIDFSLSSGNINITEEGNYKQIIFTNNEKYTVFTLKCKWIFINSVVGYNSDIE